MTAAESDTSDGERFCAWVREHGRAVRGFLLARIHRPDLADDLTQEVFRRAWGARHRYREQSSARAYLLRIADRLARNSRRVRRPVNLGPADWQRCEAPSSAAGPSETAALLEEAERLAAVMAKLSPLQQRVLLLRYYGDLGFAEIAEIIGCPKNTALSHCRRGLEALRKLLVEKDERRL